MRSSVPAAQKLNAHEPDRFTDSTSFHAPIYWLQRVKAQQGRARDSLQEDS